MVKTKLKDVCSVIVPMRDKPKYFVDKASGTPWCRIEDVRGKYLYGTTSDQYVDTETIQKMRLKVFPSGTVICACTGASIGTYAITKTPLITNQTFAGLVCNDDIYNHYLYYFVKLYTKAFINKSVGCAQAYISRETFENIEIDLPSLEQQKRNVAILEAIDELIVVNNKLIETSENLMREIYDYWFIQFDFPNEDGRPYKSSGGEMVYDEKLKREIPKDWSSTTLGELYDIYQPGILSVKQCDPDGEYEVHGSNGIIGRYHEYNHEDSEIIVSCRGDCGNIHRTMPKTWITGNAMVIKPKAKTNQSREYLKNMLGTLGIKNISTGSVQGQITRTNLAPINIIAPSEAVLEKYAKIVAQTTDLIITTNLENKRLEELRDWLLPMLMSGQAKIND